MSDHIVTTTWREADIAALDQRVQAMEEWLHHTGDLVWMFGENDPISTELLSMAGLVRSRRNDVSQEADKMKAILIDRKQLT